MSELHPHLINALKTVVSFSKEDELKFFRIGVKRIIENHLTWMKDWLDTNQRIFDKLTKVTADTHEDDIALCILALEEWENEDRLVGMRYNALSQKCTKLMSAEKKQILLEELALHDDKLEDFVARTNALAKSWLKKLEKHTYQRNIATALDWLAKVTKKDLISNYERWEKEKI
jgi:hypothetical protein